jgi:hypothetical protein
MIPGLSKTKNSAFPLAHPRQVIFNHNFLSFLPFNVKIIFRQTAGERSCYPTHPGIKGHTSRRWMAKGAQVWHTGITSMLLILICDGRLVTQ